MVFEVADYESIIRFSKFKMANPIWRTKIYKKSRNWMKIGILRLLGSLITNLSSDFKNSRWRIQYDENPQSLEIE